MRRASESRPGIRYFEGEHASIRYRLAGDTGPVIVLTPDPPLTIEHYDALIEQLASNFRVCVFDIPGFGFSYPKPGLRFDFVSMTREIEQFLVALELGPYVLAFSCVAGYSAVDIAARQASLVSHVVFIQTPAWQEELRWKARRDRFRLLGTPLVGQCLLYILRRSRSLAWLNVAVNDVATRDHCAAVADQCLERGAGFRLASVFQDYLVGPTPVTESIVQPALIVWGTSDRSHRGTDRQSSFELAPHARSVSMQQAGHFPEIEYPRDFAAHVLKFVQDFSR